MEMDGESELSQGREQVSNEWIGLDWNAMCMVAMMYVQRSPSNFFRIGGRIEMNLRSFLRQDSTGP
jgi:hypothetical protein